jgi:transposase-like protein
MSTRVTPSERLRAEIDEVFAGSGDLSGAIEQVARLGARLLLQSALEAEVTEFLGRERYAKAALTPDANEGMRNGYSPVTVKTTAGPVTLQRPKLRGTSEKFASRLFGESLTRTNALESLVIAGFVRGLSVRDVEATLADALGPEAALSKSTVSRVCQAIKDDYDAWGDRSLSEVELDYLFLDGSHFKYHAGAKAEPLLAAWGISTEAKPAFVGLAPAANEGNDAWDGFLDDMGSRGLCCPLLVISDGAAGLVGAIERAFPQALRQRCLIHRARNILAKTPKHAQAELKKAYWELFEVPEEVTPGPDAVSLVQRRIDAFAAKYAKLFPAAVACLLDDRAALTSYLRFPREHWQRIRHSNFIERTFGETRRRVKVIGRLPGEASCTKLVWAVLDRASRSWRGFNLTSTGLRLLQDLRHQLLHPPTPIREKLETSAGWATERVPGPLTTDGQDETVTAVA